MCGVDNERGKKNKLKLESINKKNNCFRVDITQHLFRIILSPPVAPNKIMGQT